MNSCLQSVRIPSFLRKYAFRVLTDIVVESINGNFVKGFFQKQCFQKSEYIWKFLSTPLNVSKKILL